MGCMGILSKYTVVFYLHEGDYGFQGLRFTTTYTHTHTCLRALVGKARKGRAIL